MDFKFSGAYQVWFFWKPHLEKVVELMDFYQAKKSKEDLRWALHALIKRHTVQSVILNTYKKGVMPEFCEMTRGEKEAVLPRLKRSELCPKWREYRQVAFTDKIYLNRNVHFLNHAQRFMDRLPEPWETPV